MLSVSLLLTAFCAAFSFWLSLRSRNLALAIRRAALLKQDQALAYEQAPALSATQQASEIALETTTRTVQAVHQGIASIPFGILESIPATRDVTRVVRAAHDLTANTVYGAISAVNKLVGHGWRASLPRQGSTNAGGTGQKN